MAKTGALSGSTGNISIPKWGKMQNYSAYFYAFIFSQAAVVSAYLMLRWTVFNRWGRRNHLYQSSSLTALLVTLYLLYLPVSIAALRILYCETEETMGSASASSPASVQYLSADPQMVCWTGPHLACVICLVFFFAPVFLGYPVYLYTIIQDGCAYQCAEDHEKRLQAWEMGFILGLDSHWMQGNVWIFGSFTLQGANMRLHMVVLKATLVLLSFSLRSELVSQASAMWWAIAAFSVYNGLMVWRSFRVLSTEIVWKTLVGLLLANTSLALVNAFGMRNAATTASTESILLLAIHVAAIFFLAATLMVTFLNPLAVWPTAKSCNSLVHNPMLAPLTASWLAALWGARELAVQLAATPYEITDPSQLEGCLHNLRRAWLQARSSGSLFQLLLSDAIEDTSLAYALRADRMFRLNTHWNEAYAEACSRSLWTRRAEQLALIPGHKRRILQKLFSLRLFKLRGNMNRRNEDLVEAQHYHRVINDLKTRTRKEPTLAHAEEMLYYWDNILDTLESQPAILQTLRLLHLDKVATVLGKQHSSRSSAKVSSSIDSENTNTGLHLLPAKDRERVWEKEIEGWYVQRAELRERVREYPDS